MILLNRTLCSKDFRKVGIIHSSINLVVQVIFLIILIVLVNNRIKLGLNKTDLEKALTNIFISALFFTILDALFYSSLILGLILRKSYLLLVWLCFAPCELVLVQVALFAGIYVVAGLTTFAYTILAVIAHMLITTYMVHNTCVIFSARHGLIKGDDKSTGPHQESRQLTSY